MFYFLNPSRIYQNLPETASSFAGSGRAAYPPNYPYGAMIPGGARQMLGFWSSARMQ